MNIVPVPLLIHVGQFRQSFHALVPDEADPALESIQCDISIDDVRIITPFEQVQQAIQTEIVSNPASQNKETSNGRL